jgi:hypothetical protein
MAAYFFERWGVGTTRSLAAAFGGVALGTNTNATVKFLQLLCNRAQHIFCTDADWD